MTAAPVASRSLRRLVAPLLALWVLVCVASPAHAEDRATRLARRHFEKGEKLFALGRFEEALTAYEAAYEARPLPGFLFNIGQCHRNLGDIDSAIFSFRRYLELAPDARNAEAVRAYLLELEREQAARRAPPEDLVSEPAPEPEPPPIDDPGPGARAVAPAPRRSRPPYRAPWFWGGLAAIAGAALVTLLVVTDDRVPDTDLGHVVFP